MRKFLLCMLLAVIAGLTGNSVHAEELDIDWCITLLEIKDNVDVPDSVAEPMAYQCAILQNGVIAEIRRICKIEDADARKYAADQYNQQHAEEIDIYELMVRALKEYMERDCLGPAAALMSCDIVKKNTQINAMFTIFRSRRPLPDNIYTK